MNPFCNSAVSQNEALDNPNRSNDFNAATRSLNMKRVQEAQRIDQEEFKQESQALLARALDYSRTKKDKERRILLIILHGEAGKHMPLWPQVEPIEPPAHQKLYTVNGETRTYSQWAKHLGLTCAGLEGRVQRLGSFEAAINAGRARYLKLFTYDGKTMSIDEWTEELGVSRAQLRYRTDKLGMTMQEALAEGSARTIGITRTRTSTRKPRENLGPLSLHRTHTHNGETRTVREWAEHLGLKTSTLQARIVKKGIAQAIANGPRMRAESGPPKPETPVRKQIKHTYNGQTKTVDAWAKQLGISSKTLRNRIYRHGIDRALAMGPGKQTTKQLQPTNDNHHQTDRGASSNLPAFQGTGVGAIAQEFQEIAFHKETSI